MKKIAHENNRKDFLPFYLCNFMTLKTRVRGQKMQFFFQRHFGVRFFVLIQKQAATCRKTLKVFQCILLCITEGDLTQVFPTFWNPIVNLDFHMMTASELSWVSNGGLNSVELPTICSICDHAAILKKKTSFLSIRTYL